MPNSHLASIISNPLFINVAESMVILSPMDHVELDFEDDALKAIAHEALARNAGARGLRAIIEGIMKNVMYEVPSRDNVEKCIVTADVVTKHKEPKLLLKQEDNDTRKNA